MVTGRPRYWIGWYDRWHLILPAMCLGLALWLVSRPEWGARQGSRPPTPGGERAQGIPLPPLAPTVIDSPLTGSRVRVGSVLDLRGRAAAYSKVRLFYRGEDGAEEVLAENDVDEFGRFRFELTGFGMGRCQLRIVATASDGRQQSSLPVEYIFVRPR